MKKYLTFYSLAVILFYMNNINGNQYAFQFTGVGQSSLCREMLFSLAPVKKCGRCKEIKNISKFHKSSDWCIKCYKEWYETNKEKIHQQRKQFRENNKEKIKQKYLIYEFNKKEKIIINRKQYHLYKKDIEQEKCRKSYQKNKKKINRRRVEYICKRIHYDINFKLRRRISERIRFALKSQRTNKNNKTIDLLGCSIPKLKQHLESQFKPGMTWQNYGKWHIDHIQPCSGFNLTDQEQQKQCFNYKNLQPLWALDNIRKSNKTA